MISAGGILRQFVKRKRHHIISRGLKEELTLPTPTFCNVGATLLRDIWETHPGPATAMFAHYFSVLGAQSWWTCILSVIFIWFLGFPNIGATWRCFKDLYSTGEPWIQIRFCCSRKNIWRMSRKIQDIKSMAPIKIIWRRCHRIYNQRQMADRTSSWTTTSPPLDLQLQPRQIFLGVSCWGGTR